MSAAALAVRCRIDELHLAYPFAGARMLRDLLQRDGHAIGRRHVATLMRRMGIEAVYRKPHTSQRHRAHRVYPYLLRHLEITRPNHVWTADITSIPMQRGVVYLVAVLDWASRRVLSWRLSNTLTIDFCLEAFQEAITRYGTPAIFNTDQGCQFTSLEFTGLLKDQGIQISMNGTGCWRDNVFVERPWKRIKYEEGVSIRLRERQRRPPGLGAIRDVVLQPDQTRPHRALDGHTSNAVYFDNLPHGSRPRRQSIARLH